MEFKIELNPDKQKVAEIKLLIKQSGGYCPCQLFKTEDTKCICKIFKEQKEEGWCHCELYFKTTKESEESK